jgi:hypothetical protein
LKRLAALLKIDEGAMTDSEGRGSPTRPRNALKFLLTGINGKIAALTAFLVAVLALINAGSAVMQKTWPAICSLGTFIPWCPASTSRKISPASSVCVTAAADKHWERLAVEGLREGLRRRGLNVVDDCDGTSVIVGITGVTVADPRHDGAADGPPGLTTAAHIDFVINGRTDEGPISLNAAVSGSASGDPAIDQGQLTRAALKNALEQIIRKIQSLTEGAPR